MAEIAAVEFAGNPVRQAFGAALTVNAGIGVGLVLFTAVLVIVRLRHLGTR